MILQGKILISTVAPRKSEKIRNIFGPLGAVVIDFPVTECIASNLTPDIYVVISQIEKFDWIVFTSANGVSYFNKLLKEAVIVSGIASRTKIAAIGTETALELKNAGMIADYTGTRNNAEGFVNEFIENTHPENLNILLPLGNLATDTLQTRLSKIANVTRINIYKTIKASVSDSKAEECIINNNYDLILFTSPSGVMNFADAIGPENIKMGLRTAAIGKVTARAAEQYGLQCIITAETSTYEGLANEIINYYNKTKN